MYPNQPPNGQHGFQPYPMDWNAQPPKSGFQLMPPTSRERWKYAGIAFAANLVLSICVAALTGTWAAVFLGLFAISLPLGPVVWTYAIAAVVAMRREKAAASAPSYQPYPQQFQQPQQPPASGGYYNGQ